ncbi:MAG: hypothetical protein E7258_07950 [Lachnospiraceae bacterium]|nr:hypothetical protein [Lachnospiraceae bacterium]
MENMDTINLLKECDAGVKMGVSAIDEVLDSVQSTELSDLLTESKAHHQKLGNEIHSLLIEYGSEEKDPNPMAKGMSWFKTNMKLQMDKSDQTVAELITDGCNMGVKSLNEYLNQYQSANDKVRDICKRLIRIEDELCKELRGYL